MTSDPLAANATALLLACARGDEGAGRQYFELLFVPIRDIVRQRSGGLMNYARRLIGQANLTLPVVPDRDLDDLASDVAIDALARAQRTAGRFDPLRGDGFSWALTAAAYSYLDVVRREYASKRRQQELLVDDEQFARLEHELPAAVGLEEHAEQRSRLDQALAKLTDDERYVVVAKLQYGLSYVEIAEYRFGGADERTVRRVGKLLELARAKLRKAELEGVANSGTERGGPAGPR